MKPIHTAASNLVYTGPTPDILDMHCERIVEGQIKSVWWLTPAERLAIAHGANIRLSIFTEPIPPISMGVTDEQGVGEDAPELLNRLEVVRG